MKLGIISDCIHYQAPNGKIGTENHILLRQLTALCNYFESTLICCPFAEYDTSKVLSFYQDASINFEKMPVAGGDNFSAKLRLLKILPRWLGGYKKIDRFSNVVYMRFPNNINLPAFFYFQIFKKKVFATYTGTWSGYKTEPASYQFQRYILKKFFRGPVWVYNNEPIKAGRIKPGFSPSYSKAEWEEETEQVRERIQNIKAKGLTIYRFITVGTLINYKNQLAIVKACKVLKEKDFPFELTIVGDGPMKNELQDYINSNGLQQQVIMAGKKDHIALRQLYRNHDFVLQAPLKEGFGKVPVEGFFHGLIPIINNVSMANNMTGNGTRGFLFDAGKPNSLVETLLALPAKTGAFSAMIENGRNYAETQTLEAWADEYYKTVSSYYNEA